MGRLASILFVLSLIVCLGLCGLWIAGGWRCFYLTVTRTPGCSVRAICGDGTVAIEWDLVGAGLPVDWHVDVSADVATSIYEPGPPLGHVRNRTIHYAWCPVWVPILLTGIPPAVWGRRRRGHGTGFPVSVPTTRSD